jgi:phenylpropionate dioxygenase-like ring-hydroxylating dioxygenase large terminal subunit
MPSEPAESNFKDKVRIPAYPTYEVGGMIFCYMGPPEKKPAPPLFAWTQAEPEKRAMSKVWQECNWLQALEGGIDTVHANFLHGGRPPGLRYGDDSVQGRARNISLAPLLEVVPTDYGYCYAGIRTLGEEGDYVKAYHWIFPWYQIRNSATNAGHIWIPMDDENTMVYNWTVVLEEVGRERPPAEDGPDLPVWLRDARRYVGNGNQFVEEVAIDLNFRSIRNADNRYLIDRHLQKTQSFSGITGINTQDRAIQESMGPIADRTLERLGTTDRAIIQTRRSLLQAIKTVQDGGDPPGLEPSYYRVRGYETILPKGLDWYHEMRPVIFMEESPPATATL